MAEQLKDDAVKLFQKGSGDRYPAEWFNGKAWRITLADRPGCRSIAILRNALCMGARGRGGRLRTSIESDVAVIIQFIPRTEPAKPRSLRAAS